MKRLLIPSHSPNLCVPAHSGGLRQGTWDYHKYLPLVVPATTLHPTPSGDITAKLDLSFQGVSWSTRLEESHVCSTVQLTCACNLVCTESATYSLISECVTSYAYYYVHLSRLKMVLEVMVNFLGKGGKVNDLEGS